MQATLHSLQRIGRPACHAPAQRYKAMLLSPRTSVPPMPHPMVQRRYSLDFSGGPDKAADTVNTADAGNAGGMGSTGDKAGGTVQTNPRPRASDLLPHQIQQVLLVSKGMACSVGQPLADIQAQLLMQASHDEPVPARRTLRQAGPAAHALPMSCRSTTPMKSTGRKNSRLPGFRCKGARRCMPATWR